MNWWNVGERRQRRNETLDPHKPVTKEQFEISDEGITLTPTGCNFTPYEGGLYDGTCREGDRGSKLHNGDDYDVRELDETDKNDYGPNTSWNESYRAMK